MHLNFHEHFFIKLTLLFVARMSKICAESRIRSHIQLPRADPKEIGTVIMD